MFVKRRKINTLHRSPKGRNCAEIYGWQQTVPNIYNTLNKQILTNVTKTPWLK